MRGERERERERERETYARDEGPKRGFSLRGWNEKR